MAWFSVRGFFALDSAYEERVSIWEAESEDGAISRAEAEAERGADDIDGRYLGLAQSYAMFDEPVAGAEIFSLIRSSDLGEDDYLATFFNTGAEHQRHA